MKRVTRIETWIEDWKFCLPPDGLLETDGVPVIDMDDDELAQAAKVYKTSPALLREFAYSVQGLAEGINEELVDLFKQVENA